MFFRLIFLKMGDDSVHPRASTTITRPKGALRVLPPIFDPSLSAQFLKIDDARTNRVFSLKQLTPKVHGNTISDDTAPTSGSSELIKFKTKNAIYFCYSYPILMTIPSFDWKFYWLSEMGIRSWIFLSKNGILPKNGIFSKKRNTLNMFWFSWKLVSRLIRLCWFQKSNRFCSRTPYSRVENFG